MARKYLEIAFTPAVLGAQERAHGRSRPVSGAPEIDPLGLREQEFVAARDGFYMATVTQSGWPYLQHRGGPPGFLRVLDSTTLAFADYEGNRQMITAGNLAADDRVSLFLMDYPNRRRLKIFGHARFEDAIGNEELLRLLPQPPGGAPAERIVVIEVVSFDWNCPKYITPRFTESEVEATLGHLRRRVVELEARLSHAGNAEGVHRGQI
jgi:predicted pyridoxine 5'-phosphate oxidase superfamily flavin-nucleotide-binding protein